MRCLLLLLPLLIRAQMIENAAELSCDFLSFESCKWRNVIDVDDTNWRIAASVPIEGVYPSGGIRHGVSGYGL